MAAEAIVSVFLDKLVILLIQETRFLRGVHDQVQWIESEVRQMHSFLRDAEEREVTSDNVRTWVADIQELAYKAENLIDDFMIKKAQQRRKRLLKRYVIFRDLIALRKFGREIERIQMSIRSLSDRRITYGIESIIEDSRSTRKRLRERRWSSPRSHETTITVGIERDVELLRRRLIHGDLGLHIISIVGMGGLGKTTLAQELYKSSHHFDCFAWIYVSQQYETRELLREMEEKLKKSMKGTISTNCANEVEENLFHFLKDRKYLIVMDDVWTTDVWTTLKGNFPDNATGSRIVLTTRKRHVAFLADNSPHEVNLLNEPDDWKLFTSIVFKADNSCPSELEEYGLDIVRKCGGLPLSIVLIGGLLSIKDKSPEVWCRVRDSLTWLFNEDPHYTAILALSYYDLPFYLKPCFLYLGAFPEGFMIPVKKLIRLWIAEGFVQQRDGEELEDVGKDYIDELADRNIIQLTNVDLELPFLLSPEDAQKKNAARGVKVKQRKLTCTMHDFVRELSISMAKKAKFLDVYVNIDCDTSHNQINERVRRVAMHFDGTKSLSSKYSFPNLHSLLLFDLREGETQREEDTRYVVHKSILADNRFVWLKVLDLEGTYKPRLPKALGKLIHLRYLGLRSTWLRTLPSSVADLFNLQTLDLKYTDISVIPSAIWRMQQLRHLYLNGGVSIKVLIQPSDNNSYESLSRTLRTLTGIYVGPEDCVTDRLEKFTRIRKLAIEGDLMSQGEALGQWIGRLDRLEHLKLRSTAGEQTIGSSNFLTPSDNSFAFPLRLKNFSLTKLHLEGKLNDQFHFYSFILLSKLTLVGTQLESDTMSSLEHLPYLRILRLWYNSYLGKLMLFHSRSFLRLVVLEVCWLDKLEMWRMEEGAMPNLRELEINKCNKLIQLPDGLEYLTNLRELRLPSMSDELESRVLPNTGEDWCKIQHIPFISPPLCIDAPFTASAFASTAAAASTSLSSHRPTV